MDSGCFRRLHCIGSDHFICLGSSSWRCHRICAFHQVRLDRTTQNHFHCTNTSTTLKVLFLFFPQCLFIELHSEAGADPPQSGFFSLMILVSCIWSTITMIIRYSIVRQLLRLNQGEWLNTASLCVGFTSIFGLSIVAAYPVRVFTTFT